MFTGIIQSVAEVEAVQEHNGIKTLIIKFPTGFCNELAIGASISIDGVCLTVTECIDSVRVKFDVMLQSLLVTTLHNVSVADMVNAERAAKDGAEIGGHPLSGHIDFQANISDIAINAGNYKLRISVPSKWLKYIFPKGYIAINGASLTLSDVDKKNNWFEVWLIPETRRMTNFEGKGIGDALNIEIERGTQVVVDTVINTIEERFGDLFPVLEGILKNNGVDVSSLAHPVIGLDKKTDKIP